MVPNSGAPKSAWMSFTLASMERLARAYQDAGHPDEAIRIFQQVLESQGQSEQDVHWRCMSMHRLAEVYFEVNRREEALSTLEQLVAAQRDLSKNAPQHTGRFSITLAQVAYSALQHEQYGAAETYLRECLSIRKTWSDDWRYFNAQSLLGAALAGQGRALLATDQEAAVRKFAEAEPLLTAGYDGMKQRQATIPPAYTAHLTEALQRLVDLYTGWDKPDQVAKWQAQLAAATAERSTPDSTLRRRVHLEPFCSFPDDQ